MSFASFAPLPAPSSGASSIWARRMITKSVPTSDAEVELNVLSLLLDVPLAALDEHELATSPVALHTPASPWAPGPVSDMGFAHASPLSLEMHAAQTAVKAALDVLEEPSLSRGLRISTAIPAAAGGRGCLTAPLSPALSSPVSPAESCFSTADEGLKKKGRARMSQEKRKRLARRREREALVATLGPLGAPLPAALEPQRTRDARPLVLHPARLWRLPLWRRIRRGAARRVGVRHAVARTHHRLARSFQCGVLDASELADRTRAHRRRQLEPTHAGGAAALAPATPPPRPRPPQTRLDRLRPHPPRLRLLTSPGVLLF
ncbi:hypothetical protein L1887_57714 [Cichorium endivia]|nr:hypothetical protein L1887_57714 [Cichorium endivia]